LERLQSPSSTHTVVSRARVAAWFLFRLDHVDFRERDFSEYDLTSCDFRSCNFGQVDFKYARFAGAGPHGSIEGWDLSYAELDGVSLFGANLSNTKLFKSLIAA